MKPSALFFGITICFFAIATFSPQASAEKHKWNNPENERRYKEAKKQEADYRKQEAKAWNSYDRKLEGAENTTRCVRNQALRGNVRPIKCAKEIR